VNKSYPVNLMSPMRRAAEPTIYATRCKAGVAVCKL